MKDKKKNKDLSTGGTSTREKMLARKKQLAEKGSNGGIIYPKEGTIRVRIKSPGDDKELGMEIVTFYMGKENGSIISPATFDEPCPFMEKYQQLKNSEDPADKLLAKDTLHPSRKYVIGGLVFKDEKGTEVDYDGKDKVIQIPRSIYQDIIDLYLDEDEAGDMTDPVKGYDIKIIRTGSGKLDTTYSARACKNTIMDKKYRGNIDLEGIIRGQVKSYDELEEILNNYLNNAPAAEEGEEEVKPKKKKKKHGKKDKDDLPF